MAVWRSSASGVSSNSRALCSAITACATGPPGTRARAPRTGCRRSATPPSRPAPARSTSSGTTMSRSSGRRSVPGICTARASAAVSLTNSGWPLCNRLPMMPRPGSMTVALSLVGDLAQRDDGAVASGRPPSRRRKMALFCARQQFLGVRGDAVHHGGEVERRREVAAHLGERVRLALRAPCVSSNRRAFSSAMPMPATTVCSRRGRRRVNASSRSSRRCHDDRRAPVARHDRHASAASSRSRRRRFAAAPELAAVILGVAGSPSSVRPVAATPGVEAAIRQRRPASRARDRRAAYVRPALRHPAGLPIAR